MHPPGARVRVYAELHEKRLNCKKIDLWDLVSRGGHLRRLKINQCDTEKVIDEFILIFITVLVFATSQL